MINIQMEHNSIVILTGDTFQETYTYQVDPLDADEPERGPWVSLHFPIKARGATVRVAYDHYFVLGSQNVPIPNIQRHSPLFQLYRFYQMCSEETAFMLYTCRHASCNPRDHLGSETERVRIERVRKERYIEWWNKERERILSGGKDPPAQAEVYLIQCCCHISVIT